MALLSFVREGDTVVCHSKREDYRCCVPGCITTKRGKRSVAVHHREPGNSDPGKMLTLCLGCHAKVTRTNYVQDDWPEFLRVLWREQHPDGQEQHSLQFIVNTPALKKLRLFTEEGQGSTHE